MNANREVRVENSYYGNWSIRTSFLTITGEYEKVALILEMGAYCNVPGYQRMLQGGEQNYTLPCKPDYELCGPDYSYNVPNGYFLIKMYDASHCTIDENTYKPGKLSTISL